MMLSCVRARDHRDRHSGDRKSFPTLSRPPRFRRARFPLARLGLGVQPVCLYPPRKSTHTHKTKHSPPAPHYSPCLAYSRPAVPPWCGTSRAASRSAAGLCAIGAKLPSSAPCLHTVWALGKGSRRHPVNRFLLLLRWDVIHCARVPNALCFHHRTGGNGVDDRGCARVCV